MFSTMKFSLILALIIASVLSDSTQGNIVKRYLQYLRDEGKLTGRLGNSQNLKTRLSLFKTNVKLVEDNNAKHSSYKLEINRFSDLSDDELAQYHGLNASLVAEEEEELLSSSPLLPVSVPDAVDWIAQGYVTPAKDQGKCGSCWAFGSTVALEGSHKKATGTLKNFAEQEYLDCAFTSRDGCTGGATHVCFDFNKRTGHMASQDAYPYTATDADRSVCDLTKYKNSLIAAKVTSRVTSRHVETEENTIKLLSIQPVTLFIEATRTLHQYKEGILLDRTCWSETNHAVAGVGYTPQYIIVKNSWGASWGESGFFKLLRGWSNCGLYLRAQYPVMESNGEKETEEGAEQALYDHTAIVGPDPPKPDPDCDNGFGDIYCSRMTRSSCHSPQIRNSFCRKACNNCWID